MSDHGACALVGCPLCSPRNLTLPTITVSSGTPRLDIGPKACQTCNGTGFVNPGGWSYPRAHCPSCFGTGATFQFTPARQPAPIPKKDHVCTYDNYELGSGVGCKICDSRRAAREEPAQEKPKKMNWPIAIYSQNGELPIKFAIEREEPFPFSIRLINQFSEGWWVSVWFQTHEVRGVRAETLEKAESEARDIINELVWLFSSVADSLGVTLDSRG